MGATLGFHILTYLARLNESLTDLARLSPFHYYLGSDPLNNGVDRGDAVLVVTLSVVLIGLSLTLFQRRDIRQRA